MDLTRRIDNYCERMSEAFWAEPLNAVTNGAFLIAALYCLVLAYRAGRLDGSVGFLIVTLSAIGIGSFLFHTYATAWAALTDVIPIGIFILGYFAIAMHAYIGFSWLQTAGAMVVFLIALVAVSWVMNTLLRDVIGGSVSYGPALLAIFVVGAWLRFLRHPAAGGLFLAGGVFVLSLGFRSIDIPLCDALPFGTHFLWHVCNSVVLGALILTLIRHGKRQPDAQPGY
ncbi:MAG: ceramidase domain-containing protein [Pseudomonadota bacterium]